MVEELTTADDGVPEPTLEMTDSPVLGVCIDLGEPAETALTAIPAPASHARRVHSSISTAKLREDLNDLVAVADCPTLPVGLRATFAVEARHVLATLLARARADDIEGSGSGVPTVTFDDGSPNGDGEVGDPEERAKWEDGEDEKEES